MIGQLSFKSYDRYLQHFRLSRAHRWRKYASKAIESLLISLDEDEIREIWIDFGPKGIVPEDLELLVERLKTRSEVQIRLSDADRISRTQAYSLTLL